MYVKIAEVHFQIVENIYLVNSVSLIGVLMNVLGKVVTLNNIVLHIKI